MNTIEKRLYAKDTAVRIEKCQRSHPGIDGTLTNRLRFVFGQSPWIAKPLRKTVESERGPQARRAGQKQAIVFIDNPVTLREIYHLNCSKGVAFIANNMARKKKTEQTQYRLTTCDL